MRVSGAVIRLGALSCSSSLLYCPICVARVPTLVAVWRKYRRRTRVICTSSTTTALATTDVPTLPRHVHHVSSKYVYFVNSHQPPFLRNAGRHLRAPPTRRLPTVSDCRRRSHPTARASTPPLRRTLLDNSRSGRQEPNLFAVSFFLSTHGRLLARAWLTLAYHPPPCSCFSAMPQHPQRRLFLHPPRPLLLAHAPPHPLDRLVVPELPYHRPALALRPRRLGRRRSPRRRRPRCCRDGRSRPYGFVLLARQSCSDLRHHLRAYPAELRRRRGPGRHQGHRRPQACGSALSRAVDRRRGEASRFPGRRGRRSGWLDSHLWRPLRPCEMNQRPAGPLVGPGGCHDPLAPHHRRGVFATLDILPKPPLLVPFLAPLVLPVYIP